MAGLGRKNPHEFILKTDLLYADGPAEYDGFHALPSPTLDVAQRWLREVKHLDISIHYDPTIKSQPYVYFIYDVEEKFNDILGIISPITHSYSDGYFYKYEEAQEEGIKKALEIINKGE